jgi:glycerol kinase
MLQKAKTNNHVATFKQMSNFFKIPLKILAQVKPSGHHFGNVLDGPFKGVPITAVIGDQSAALVGQNCVEVGSTKATFGTGCFILQNIGSGTVRDAMRGVPREASSSLITTLAYQLKDKQPVYALEGSVAIAGAAITWLRDNISLINDYKEIEPLARSVDDSGGVFFVPAFQGLYAPYWDANAAGILIGLSGFSRKAHIILATLEAIAFQTVDILSLMRRDASGMMIDGGMACNDLLCQILSDLTGIEIIRPQTIEATALGVAMIAGNTIGIWDIREPDSMFDSVPPLTPVTPLVPEEQTTRKLTKRESILSFFSRSVSTKSGSFVKSLSSRSHQAKAPKFPAGCEIFYPKIGEDLRSERINAWRLAIERCMKWTKIKKLEEKRVDYRRKSTIPVGFFLLSSFGILMLSNYFS